MVRVFAERLLGPGFGAPTRILGVGSAVVATYNHSNDRQSIVRPVRLLRLLGFRTVNCGGSGAIVRFFTNSWLQPVSYIEDISEELLYARVRAVDEDVDEEYGELHLQFLTGNVRVVEVSDTSEFTVGCVVLVSSDYTTIELAPEGFQDDDSWIGVVHRKSVELGLPLSRQAIRWVSTRLAPRQFSQP